MCFVAKPKKNPLKKKLSSSTHRSDFQGGPAGKMYVLFCQSVENPILFQPGGTDKNFSHQEECFCLAKKKEEKKKPWRARKKNSQEKQSNKSWLNVYNFCLFYYAILCFQEESILTTDISKNSCRWLLSRHMNAAQLGMSLNPIREVGRLIVHENQTQKPNETWMFSYPDFGYSFHDSHDRFGTSPPKISISCTWRNHVTAIASTPRERDWRGARTRRKNGPDRRLAVRCIAYSRHDS